MIQRSSICAIIPARSGSKSIRNKNIRILHGKPMLAYSIEHALKSKYINRVIVSTDSEKYAEIAEIFGAEIPFIRPVDISTDTSLDIEVFQHALNFLKENENYVPEIVVHLRPTYPIRDINDIDNMIDIITSNKNIDSVRSISLCNETPYKMWREKENGMIEPLLNDIFEAYNTPRQYLPKVYLLNGSIDVIRTSVITDKNSMTGDSVFGYKMDHCLDIDDEKDFEKVENYLENLL